MPVAFIKYEDQQEILPLCATLTPLVEPYKDEGIFLGLDNSGREKFAASKLFKKGRCGVAASKLTARVVSMVLGRSGNPAVLQGDESAFLAPLPVDFLWPLDEKVIKHLKILGLGKIEDVTRISKEELSLQFGEEGNMIYNYSRGIDNRPVLPVYPSASMQLKRSFGGIFIKEALETVLKEMVSDLSAGLLSSGRGTQSLCIEFIEENGHTSNISRNFSGPVSVFGKGLAAAITSGLTISSPVVEIRASAKDLKPAQFTQRILWEELPSGKKSDVNRLAVAMRDKFPSQRICCAGEIQVSRREKVLSFWDPFRYVHQDRK